MSELTVQEKAFDLLVMAVMSSGDSDAPGHVQLIKGRIDGGPEDHYVCLVSVDGEGADRKTNIVPLAKIVFCGDGLTHRFDASEDLFLGEDVLNAILKAGGKVRQLPNGNYEIIELPEDWDTDDEETDPS